jgi:two-component system, cell cycle sensor histidine kinase and response regulator CckA
MVQTLVPNHTHDAAADQLRKLCCALEQSPVSVAITDLNGTIEYVNAEFCRVTGFALAEVIGQNPRVLKSGHHPPEFYQGMWNQIAAGQTWRGELCNRKKNGELYWERTSISPIHDDGGRTTHFVAVKEDITNRKRAEADLAKSQAKLICALAIAKTGFWEWDLVENVMHRSPETLAMHGLGPELATVSFEAGLESIHRDDLEYVKYYLDAALREPRDNDYQLDFRIARPDGETRYVTVHGRIVARDEGGHPTLVVGTVTDITERKQIELLRQAQERELHRRQAHRMELVGQLAGGIAHEFNNLLQGILGYSRLALAAAPPEGNCHDDLQEVISAAERAARLTRQLLGFSRRQLIQPQKVDPNTAVADLVKMVRPLIGEHIALETDCGRDVGAVWADPSELQQVLLNLCLNARDAMPGGGRLTIHTDRRVLTEPFADANFVAQPGAYVVFTVADTGCGMDEEVRARIFEPFFTTKEVGKGTGLGLAMVYGVVQDHHGAIRVESEIGRGASFQIYLPVADSRGDRAIDQERAATDGGHETILLAEDEPVVRKYMERVLRGAGYRVLTAPDGEQALRMLHEESAEIDLILLDAIMPGINGHEVFLRAHRLYPDLKFIFCSGYDPETCQLHATQEKGLIFLQKPVESARLLHAVREVLDCADVDALTV